MADLSIEIKDLKQLLAELIQSQKETDAKFKETDQKIKQAFDLFEGQWGKLMESLVEGDLIRILQERGIQVRDTSTRRKGSYHGEQYEFDIIAHNGNEIVVVEVKTTLRVKHVKQHIKRLQKIKTWLPEYKNYNIYGAIAFLRSEEESDTFAEKQQLFVIRATGDSAAIMNASDFKARIF
ncbi:MAG: YraN family protein [Chitinophagales bacterium]|nr:YraN family protein [Chitinophagales bacterium]